MATKELITGIVHRVETLPLTKRFDRGGTSILTDADDLSDDLSEINSLIDDLRTTCMSLTRQAENSANCSHNSFIEAIDGVIEKLALRQQSALATAESTTKKETAEVRSLFEDLRQEYLSIKNDIRVAFRQLGTQLCFADWQSPAYSSSVSINSNRLSDGIAEHSLDYKRDGHLEAASYESQFIGEYVAHLSAKNARAYLTSSGMAAFTSVLHWLAHELQLGSVAVALKPMYFENLHLSQAFFPNLITLSAPSSQSLKECLKENRPSVILCDAVTNCGEVISHDLTTIMSWAETEATHSVAIVIDTTCFPTVLLPADFLKNVPANVSVILIESLAKFHQFGMDSVTGGIVVLDAASALHDDFRKTRARLGTNIADASVGVLPGPNRGLLIRRLHRHSRNTRVLAEQLEAIGQQSKGVIESISWQNEGLDSAPWYRSSCLSIRLQKSFRSVKHYREFELRVLDIATKRKHPIALGTSFGFDVSRFYVTAPSTPFEDPFLRISVGTETASQIETLSSIIEEVSLDLARQWGYTGREQRIEKKRGEIVSSPVKLTLLTDRPGLMASVFTGEDAIKDYLHPENYAPTPLVELPADLNPYRSAGVRLFAKMVPLVPLMNIKSIPAYSMLSKAHERGELEGVTKIIESSSSNTVLSLSVIGKLFGIDTTYAIVDHSIAPSLTRMLRLFGIEIFTHPAAGHELFGKLQPRSERATKTGELPGWLNPGQYSNPDNPEGFANWLAPDIWAQTRGQLDVLGCALGTCGTMVGVTRALRAKNPDLQVVACCPKPGEAVPGPREKSLLKDVTFQWQDVANSCVELPCEESFAASVKLLRRGILGGPSSGMNYAGMLRYLEMEKESGRLAATVEAHGELHCAFLCCDSPLPHVDEYFDALGPDFFPMVHPVPQSDDLL